MGKSVILFVALLLSYTSFAQVKFEEISFDKALQKAEEKGKMIFLQLESASCLECNEVAGKAFAEKKLGKLLLDAFVCIKLSPDNQDRELIETKYGIRENSFGSLFINPYGALIHFYPGSTSLWTQYEELANIALAKAGEGNGLSEFEALYKTGNRQFGLLEALLQKRQLLNLETDSLLAEYVSLLPADSLQSTRTLVFIIKMFPHLYGSADLKLKKDFTLFNKAWYSLPLEERIRTNALIGYKSMQKAVKEKNEQYAIQIARHIQSTYSNDRKAGLKAFHKKKLEYFMGVNDTANYFNSAITYYDHYYMTVSVDSIKRTDSSRSRPAANSKPPSDVSAASKSVIKTISYSPIAQYYTRELNNAAWYFYKNSSNPDLLSKAIEWSARSNEFFNNYDAMDTYAHLLFKTNNRNGAMIWLQKAITLKKERGYDAELLEKELLAIQSGALTIDLHQH